MNTVSKTLSVAPIGFHGEIVEVESDVTNGLPAFQVVGMGNKAIDEARERVKSAIKNSKLDFPAKRITVNLAPAELPKDGSHFDLAIALSVLASSGQLRQNELSDAVFAGELALNGGIRPVRSIITIVEAAKKQGASAVFVPAENAEQASLIEDIDIFPVADLSSLFLHLKNEAVIAPYARSAKTDKIDAYDGPFIDDVVGQEQAKRALVIAAAGHHNLLLNGSPGAGKTMLAQLIPDLLPTLSAEEQISITKLHSMAGEAIKSTVTARPFRAPHHSASRAALLGGGTASGPGDVSLAHLGVLFLDEMPEYPRSLLESLRQPLEDKQITISRANRHNTYPADFMLVGTMNPCPCGYYGDLAKECTCTSSQILNYQKRLSGPFLDRIDLYVSVTRVPHKDLIVSKSESKTQHKLFRDQIKNARALQNNRYKSSSKNNGNIKSSDVKKYISLTPESQNLLDKAATKLDLSARSYFKTIKVARTIADLDQSDTINVNHISEALQYRQTS